MLARIRIADSHATGTARRCVITDIEIDVIAATKEGFEFKCDSPLLLEMNEDIDIWLQPVLENVDIFPGFTWMRVYETSRLDEYVAETKSITGRAMAACCVVGVPEETKLYLDVSTSNRVHMVSIPATEVDDLQAFDQLTIGRNAQAMTMESKIISRRGHSPVSVLRDAIKKFLS